MLHKMNAERFHPEAIRTTYDMLGEHEAFEIFAAEGISHEEVMKALGEIACNRYAAWLYLNVK